MPNLFFLVVSINLYSFYPFLCTAEDPAEVTLQCRGLSMMAISTYAAKTRKRREKHKKDNTMTIASSEDEREDNEPAPNEDNQGFEEEEQEPLGQEKRVRKRLNQLYSNKTLVLSDQQVRHVTSCSVSTHKLKYVILK